MVSLWGWRPVSCVAGRVSGHVGCAFLRCPRSFLGPWTAVPAGGARPPLAGQVLSSMMRS